MKLLSFEWRYENFWVGFPCYLQMREPNLYYFQDFSAVCLLLINGLISFRRDVWSFLQVVFIYCGNGTCCPCRCLTHEKKQWETFECSEFLFWNIFKDMHLINQKKTICIKTTITWVKPEQQFLSIQESVFAVYSLVRYFLNKCLCSQGHLSFVNDHCDFYKDVSVCIQSSLASVVW